MKPGSLTPVRANLLAPAYRGQWATGFGMTGARAGGNWRVYWTRSSIDRQGRKARNSKYEIRESNGEFLGILEIHVALVENIKFEERGRQIRGTGRVNSRVPVAIEWTEAGQTLRAEGFTKDIGPKGCLAIVPQGFVVGQKMSVINLTNQVTCEAVLIWRGHEGPAGWELGIELREPSADFWGLDF